MTTLSAGLVLLALMVAADTLPRPAGVALVLIAAGVLLVGYSLRRLDQLRAGWRERERLLGEEDHG